MLSTELAYHPPPSQHTLHPWRGRVPSTIRGEPSDESRPVSIIATNRFNSFEGKGYAYGSFPYHGVDTVNGADRYDYDANGNMTVRDKGLSTQQTLAWNGENRLNSVTRTGINESYVYDADGQRIKKTSGGVTTRTFFPHYEQEGSTVVKYYSFNGMRVAVSKGGMLTYIHADHLGGSSLATDSTGAIIGGNTNGPVSYYAYGSVRSGTPTNLQTDRTYTGQKSDNATRLLYYNARYGVYPEFTEGTRPWVHSCRRTRWCPTRAR